MQCLNLNNIDNTKARTHNPLLPRPVFYHLSYAAQAPMGKRGMIGDDVML